MTMKRSLLGIALWLLPGVGVAQLSVSFGIDDVTVSGMTKGGEATLVSLSRESKNWMTTVTPLSVLLSDDDGDGEETYYLGSPVVKRSVWVVADVLTGNAIVVSPGQAGVQAKLDPDQAIQKGPGGLYNILEDSRSVLDLTVIRRKAGAWHIRAWDGGKNDADLQPDGKIQIDSQNMTPLTSGGSVLKDFQVGDVLLGLDHATLEFYAVLVVNPPGGKKTS